MQTSCFRAISKYARQCVLGLAVALFIGSIGFLAIARIKMAAYEDTLDASQNFTCSDVTTLKHVHTGAFNFSQIPAQARMHKTGVGEMMFFTGLMMFLIGVIPAQTERSGDDNQRTTGDKSLTIMLQVVCFIGVILMTFSSASFISAFASFDCRENPVGLSNVSYQTITRNQDYVSGFDEITTSTTLAILGYIIAFVGYYVLPKDLRFDSIKSRTNTGWTSDHPNRVMRVLDALVDARVLLPLVILITWLVYNDKNLEIKYHDDAVATLAINKTESYLARVGSQTESNYCGAHNHASKMSFVHNETLLIFSIVWASLTFVLGTITLVLKLVMNDMPKLFITLSSTRELMILIMHIMVRVCIYSFVTSNLDTVCPSYHVLDPRYRRMANIVAVLTVVDYFAPVVYIMHVINNVGLNSFSNYLRVVGIIQDKRNNVIEER